jgi:hypothetical protein
MLVMSRLRHAAIVPQPLGAGQKSGQNIQKNRCRTTTPERMVETLAELPFYGDKVSLLKPRPGRPQRPVGTSGIRGTHNGDPLRVSFSNVAVKLVGSNTWIDAQ